MVASIRNRSRCKLHVPQSGAAVATSADARFQHILSLDRDSTTQPARWNTHSDEDGTEDVTQGVAAEIEVSQHSTLSQHSCQFASSSRSDPIAAEIEVRQCLAPHKHFRKPLSLHRRSDCS